MERLRDLYKWGDMTKEDYLKEKQTILKELNALAPAESQTQNLERLAYFLTSVADAWREANQEQRNKLARVLFEEIKLDSGGKVVAVKPRLELEPSFRISFECHARDIAGDPEGIRDGRCYFSDTPRMIAGRKALALPLT